MVDEVIDTAEERLPGDPLSSWIVETARWKKIGFMLKAKEKG
jgi:hypothetical protein